MSRPCHLTPTYSPPATTQGFFADAHRFTVTAILGPMLEQKSERTTNAIGGKEKMSLPGDVRTQQQPTHPPTNTHPATIQDFFADTHRLTVKAILTQNCLYTEINEEPPTQ